MSGDRTPPRRSWEEEPRGFEPLGYKTVVFRYVKQTPMLWGLYMGYCDIDHKVWVLDGMTMTKLEEEIRKTFSKDIVSINKLIIYARAYNVTDGRYLRANIIDEVKKLQDKELYEIEFKE